ncbi:hypothetical protein JKP88DRAFT_177876 [Tribonema minus]|uniref:Uncharacterized protein n=1 Tax=Tribonema minus TaxID=303371 RepID=A0A835Z8D7_9STRA|nr:hypothetical protein JKP88DRAFT_177876 [Tribonema minus]
MSTTDPLSIDPVITKQQGKNAARNELILERVEALAPKVALVTTPLWRVTKLLFGLSILFYGLNFKTLALHIIIFRISGYKDVMQHMGELQSHYTKVRAATEAAAKNTKSLNESLAQKAKRREAREKMLVDRQQMLKDGRITAEEAQAFIAKHREELEIMAAQQEQLQATGSSLVALRSAIRWKAVGKTLRKLYEATIASITASTFEAAGRFTMAMYCGDALRDDMRTLLGPSIDPLAYQVAEVKGNVESIMMGPSAARAAFFGLAATAVLLVMFYEEPNWALKVSLCYLGSGVVVGYLKSVVCPFAERAGVRLRPRYWVLAHLLIMGVGWRFHLANCPLLRALCLPFIHALEAGNTLLNSFSMSAAHYLHREQELVAHAVADGAHAIQAAAAARLHHPQ